MIYDFAIDAKNMKNTIQATIMNGIRAGKMKHKAMVISMAVIQVIIPQA